MKNISYHGKELLPIKSDIVFKIIFGKLENRDILAKFISAMLDITIVAPDKIELTNTEVTPDFTEGKTSRFDLRAKLADGTNIEIEIQVNNEYNMIQRSLYYHAKLLSGQLMKNMNYDMLCRTVTLNILDYNLLDEEDYLNKYYYFNSGSGNRLSKLSEINYLELKKVPKKWYNEREMRSLFLATDKEEVIDMLADENKDIGKAVEKLKYVTADDQERFRINQIEKARNDYNAAMHNRYSKGLEDGIGQGIEQGIVQGIEQIAMNMMTSFDDESIHLATGIDVEMIKKLRSEHEC